MVLQRVQSTFFSATMAQNRTASLFFIHTMVLSVRSDPTCSLVALKPLPYTCTVTYSTRFTVDYYPTQHYSSMQKMNTHTLYNILTNCMHQHADNRRPSALQARLTMFHHRFFNCACEDPKSALNHVLQACMEMSL